MHPIIPNDLKYYYLPLVSHIPMMAPRRNASQVLGLAQLNRMAIICNSMLGVRTWDLDGPGTPPGTPWWP